MIQHSKSEDKIGKFKKLKDHNKEYVKKPRQKVIQTRMIILIFFFKNALRK